MRLTDKDLDGLTDYIESQQVSGQYGATFAKVHRCLTELRTLRAAMPTKDEREALEWAKGEIEELRLDDHDNFTLAVNALSRLLNAGGDK